MTNFAQLRDFTPARVALGRVGDSLPTRELLEFQLAHARARDAVHAKLDVRALSLELQHSGDCVSVKSAAQDREIYLRRPDLGRRLNDDSRRMLSERKDRFDVVFVIADGLSALAVQRHAAPVMERTRCLIESQRGNWRTGPIVIVEQGRVAIGDDVADCLGAAMVVVLIGERPGLSSTDSLGIYLTWDPRVGLTDAARNCISNVRSEGLSYEAAAGTLVMLMNAARQSQLSGVSLKLTASLAADQRLNFG